MTTIMITSVDRLQARPRLALASLGSRSGGLRGLFSFGRSP